MAGKQLDQMRRDAVKIFQTGLKAVDPKASIHRYCTLEGNFLVVGNQRYNTGNYENIYVIGAGKAGAAMSSAIEEILGSRIKGGMVNVKYGYLSRTATVTIHEAGHPVPDRNGVEGARKILELAHSAKENDLVICLLSGGGSALLPLPVEGLSLEEKQETTRLLLSCGATIHEINTVRKHISAVKGGKLAKAVYPAAFVSLILSDVVGDDLDTIASGPTVPDSTTFGQCIDVFRKYGIEEQIPKSIIKIVREGVAGRVPETPKPSDPVFKSSQTLIVGSNWECVQAACGEAATLGYKTLILSTLIEGETRDVAKVHAAIAKETLKTGNPISTPACILSGGETTVTIKGDGLGGRNMEFTLAAALELDGWSEIVVMSGGTDGTDGPTDAAGAIADGTTVERARGLGVQPQTFFRNNDSYHFFEKLDDLIKTGPTNTNVMDLRILLIDSD